MSSSAETNDIQTALSLAILQMLNKQVNKTCFEKCFSSGRFVDSLGKNEKICLAKCMDRMFEAHSIVSKASTEMAQSVQSDLSSELSHWFQFN